MTNHYKVLGLPNYSNWADVRKAYITQIKKYHPDVNSTQEAIDICKRLNIETTTSVWFGRDNNKKVPLLDEWLKI